MTSLTGVDRVGRDRHAVTRHAHATRVQRVAPSVALALAACFLSACGAPPSASGGRESSNADDAGTPDAVADAAPDGSASDIAADLPPGTAAGPWGDLVRADSLDGWIQRGGAAAYRAQGDTIVGETRPRQPNSFLCTTRAYADFELTLEFMVDPRVNSGVQFRSNARADYENGRVHGYQFEIDPTPRAWTGGVYDEGRRGWIHNLERNPDARAAFRQNQWNTLRVVAIGDHIRTWINGVPAADFHDATDASGFIALQVHDVGDRAEPMEVRWRKIRCREITRPRDDANRGVDH